MLLVALILAVTTPHPKLVLQPNLPRSSQPPTYPPAPPFPTPPNNTFYFAPPGGWGTGAQACTGQKPVDVSQNYVKYARSAGVAGDGGVSVATCIREADGLGVELGDGESMAVDLPTTPGERGLLLEAAGTNFLKSTWDLSAAAWTATATVTADIWSGPFSHYGADRGFDRINDTSGAASQSVCQTLTTSTQTSYAFSCWLRAGTLTTARLSITGTGNAAGDRTCAISGLGTTLSRGDRRGCVTASPYGAGISAVTVCVLPGAVSGDQGTIGAVDCQLEKNDHITSYIPNGWGAGTSTRLVSSASLPTAPATLTLSNTGGCAGADYYATRYDAEAWWSVISMTAAATGARGPYSGTATGASTYDGTNVVTVARASAWSSTACGTAIWAPDGGLTISVCDAGSNTGSYDGTMFGGSIAADGFLLESSSGSQDAILANVVLDTTPTACARSSMSNIARIGWLGDSISARTTPDPVNPPAGFFQRKSANGTNFAVVGARFNTAASNCVAQWVSGGDGTGGNGTYSQIFLWCGVNDILADMTGVDLFNAERAWIEEWAYRGVAVYWFDISPFKGYDSAPARLAERVAFNGLHTIYCGGPAANVHCIFESPTLADPGDTASLLPIYSFDGIHLTQAGASAASAAAAIQYP